MEPQTATPLDARSALREGMARLSAADVPSSTLSAELLLIHALGRDRTWLYTHAGDPLDAAHAERYFALIARRAAGEPTQYVIGKQEFWGLEFEVTPAVLIPRPETEHVIEVGLNRIGDARRGEPLRIADVGTGSGCIAIALAKEFPRAELVATDISAEALEVAKRNARRHAVAERVQFIEADLLKLLLHQSQVTSYDSRPFDLIVSNPPYVALSDAHSLQREIREHEPALALFGGPTGVEIYARLIEQAEALLARGGTFVVELGYGVDERVCGMIERRGAWTNLSITDDLAGIPRVLAAKRD
jgi:release factor glutamine methyltransferase